MPADLRKKQKGAAGRRLAVSFAVLAVLAALAAGLSAKYVMQADRDAEAIAAQFHVSSDYLEEPTGTPAVVPSYVMSWDASSGTFDVELYNWEVENTDSVSEVDISYKVEVAGGELASVKAGGADVAATGGARTLPKARGRDSLQDPQKKTHVLTVLPTADEVTVAVRATSPYEKALEATFDTRGVQVRKEGAGGGVTRLVIVTNQYEGDLKLRWDKSGFFPNAGVVEGPFGWTVGYEGYDGYADGEATRAVERNSTYYFEFNSCTVGNVTEQFSDTGVSYTGPGRTGAVINVA